MNYYTIKPSLIKVQNKSFKKLVGLLLFLGVFSSVYSLGSVSGVVTDAVSNETLIGATILVKGTTKGTITNIDGEYQLTDLAPGTYTLIFQSMSYDKKEIANVVVKNKEITPLNVGMSEASFTLENVVIVAKRNKESENILLMEQKEAVVAKQAVGAKEMSRKGISDAEGAVAQVSGISKQEGVKNVFVRGLGDRTNTTTLNGFPIPSEDPEYKNISLDFFGSDVIKNIGVSKVFSADLSGDVGGAVIDISSKELVADSELSIDIASGSNTSTIGSDFMKMDGVDYWGSTNSVQPGKDYKTQYIYGNSLDPSTVNLPLNYSYGLSLGKKIKLGKKANPLSFFLVGNFSSSYSYTKEKIYDTLSDGYVSEDYTGYMSAQNTNQLVLGNINFMTQKHEFSYNFLMIHDNNQEVGQYLGTASDLESPLPNQPEEYAYNGYMIRQQTNDNLLITNQFISKIQLSNKFTLNGGLAYNYVLGSEPDRRVNKLYRIDETQYMVLKGDGAHVRNFGELVETDLNGRLMLTYKLSEKFKEDVSALHIGYTGRMVNDDFIASEYSLMSMKLRDPQTLDNLSLDTWFNQANFDNGSVLGNRRLSTYQVSKSVHSAYASIDYQFTPKLTTNLGLKADQVHILVDFDVEGGNNKVGSQPLDKFYLLPSMNMKYSVTEKNALRLGLSKTYTLPQSKEISPYQYLGKKFSSQGNQELQPSENYNADLKWDYYLSPSEIFSLTTFYKYVKAPIARVYESNGAGYFTYKNISDHATVSGLELEIRKNIFKRDNKEKGVENKLSAGLSASYIYSNMVLDIRNTEARESQLEGSSPYLLNVDLSYNYSRKDMSFTNSLVMKYNSDRIYTIGSAGFEDVIEKGVPTLDFVSISNINTHWGVKVKVKNILDPEFILMRETTDGSVNQVLNSYTKGMDFSLGITYNFF